MKIKLKKEDRTYTINDQGNAAQFKKILKTLQ